MNKNELLKIKNKCSGIINLIDGIDKNGLIILLTESEKLTLDIRKFVVEIIKATIQIRLKKHLSIVTILIYQSTKTE